MILTIKALFPSRHVDFWANGAARLSQGEHRLTTCSAARGRCLHRTLVPALLCSVQCAPLSLLSRKCKEYRATELYMLTSTSKGSSCLSSTAAEIAREKLAFKKYRISGGWTRYQMPALPFIFLIKSHSYVETLLAKSLLALGVLHVNSQKLREPTVLWYQRIPEMKQSPAFYSRFAVFTPLS